MLGSRVRVEVAGVRDVTAPSTPPEAAAGDRQERRPWFLPMDKCQGVLVVRRLPPRSPAAVTIPPHCPASVSAPSGSPNTASHIANLPRPPHMPGCRGGPRRIR